MQTGNATTHEIGRHNRESMFAKGEEENAFYALGNKRPNNKKREEIVSEDAEDPTGAAENQYLEEKP